VSEEQGAVAPVETGEAPSDDWRSSLPTELQSDPSLQHIGSVEGMAKSYINAQKMVGAEKLAVPGSWATDEDWDLVYNKLGRPQDPGEYEFSLGEETNEEFTDWFRNAAHKSGLSARQVAQIAEAYQEFSGTTMQQSEAQAESHRDAVETELRQEYGGQFEAKIEAANEMLKEFEAPDLTEMRMADGSCLGDNAEMVRFMVKVTDYIKKEISEDGLAGRDSRPTLSETDIQARISQLSQKGSPYWEKHHPDHDRTVSEVLRLREQLNG
jgi:hypothetical protein